MNKAIVVYDHVVTDDPEYKQRIIDITEFYVYAPNGYDLYRTSTLTDTLTGLCQRGYEWAVVNTLGHAVDRPELFDTIVNECIAESCRLKAHLIFRPDVYPSIDPQFIVLHLPTWTELGEPAFESIAGTFAIESVSLTRSEENAHDDYTPFWISPVTGTKTTYALHNRPFGSVVTQRFLEAGHTLKNFTQEFRNSKWNLYPNYNYKELRAFFRDGTVIYPENRVPFIIDRIVNEKLSLQDTVYVLNSEPVFKYGPEFGPVDNYIGVAAGFKGVLLLQMMGFTENTTVTLLDVSNAGLDYQRYLIESWDGDLDNYQVTSKTYQDQHTEYRYAWRSWRSWDSEVALFLQEAGLSKDQFYAVWQQYRKLQHNYVQTDLLNGDADLSRTGKTYIWLSNAFDMQYTRFLYGKQYTQDKFDALLEKLKDSDGEYLVESCGQFYKLN